MADIKKNTLRTSLINYIAKLATLPKSRRINLQYGFPWNSKYQQDWSLERRSVKITRETTKKVKARNWFIVIKHSRLLLAGVFPWSILIKQYINILGMF